MDIASMLNPQARARRNARTSMHAMQLRRGPAEEAERAVVAAATGKSFADPTGAGSGSCRMDDGSGRPSYVA